MNTTVFQFEGENNSAYSINLPEIKVSWQIIFALTIRLPVDGCSGRPSLDTALFVPDTHTDVVWFDRCHHCLLLIHDGDLEICNKKLKRGENVSNCVYISQ